MKGEMRARYRWTDAWLLGAIAEASKRGPAQLWQIIAAGELLNHALFTDQEIVSGLARLTEGGWITEHDRRFSTTDFFKRKRIKIKGWDSVKKIEKLLDAESRHENEPMPHPSNNLKYPGITSEVLFKANKEYEKHAKEEWKKLKPLLERKK